MKNAQRKERSISFDVDVLSKIEQLAKQEGANVSFIVRRILRAALLKKGKA